MLRWPTVAAAQPRPTDSVALSTSMPTASHAWGPQTGTLERLGVACPAEEGSVFRCGSYLNNVCNNIAGSFECLCQDGFEKVDGVCVNVDECAAGTDTCFDATVDGFMSEICTDAEILVAGDPKFTCACPAESTMVTDGCEDNNECDNVCNQSDAIEVCVNKHFINVGLTHTCTCATGYRKEVTDAFTDPATVADNKVLTLMHVPCTDKRCQMRNQRRNICLSLWFPRD